METGFFEVRRGVAVAVLGVALQVSGTWVMAGDDAAPGIFHVDPATQLSQTDAYPPEMRVGDFDGVYRHATVFESASHEGSVVGFWESEPGVLQTDAYPVDEYCLVIEGDLLLTDADGRQQSFGPGDAFVIPKGWAGTWDMRTRFKKQFVTF